MIINMKMIRDGLNITILPEVHKRTLVWIHGFGDTAELFAEDFFQFPIVKDCKVVLPTANEFPIEMYHGELRRAWYTNLGSSTPDSSIEEGVSRINQILDHERKNTDILLIGGFSQGAAMSLLCGLGRFEGKVDGIIALSGFAFDYPFREDRKDIPVLVYHGSDDQIITLDRALSSFQRNLNGFRLQVQVDQGVGHEVTGAEYEFIKEWVRSEFKLE
jgi:predicted esterase